MPPATISQGSEPAVVVSDLVVRYGDVVAVDGVSFTAEAGQVLGFLGPNGAGKTSTIETVEGYRLPTSGTVRVLGHDPVKERSAVAPHIGVMLQSGGVYPSMGPAEALRLFASYYDEPADSKELLKRVGLAEVARTPWRRLSGGEQQRLSLALALVGRPKVAFLDEPTAGVDPHGRLVIREIVRELRNDGVCVVLTTHELDEAERLADHVVIVDRGKVLAEGSTAELRAAGGGDDIRFAATPGLPVDELTRRLAAPVVEEEPGEYRVAAKASPETVAALTAWLAERGVPLGDLRAGRHSLEDVFLRLTRRDG